MSLISPPLSKEQDTVYFSVPMQHYMHSAIKKPVLDAFAVLSNNNASRMAKLRAIKKIWDSFIAIKGLPEPTIENTWHPNSHNLIELRDWLVERCKLGVRTKIIKQLMNFVIILYDFDPPWRWIMDSWKDEALKKEWKPREYQQSKEWLETYKWWEE